jgi:hypothetical protein
MLANPNLDAPVYVLVVEDEPLNRIYASNLVEDAGFVPIEASNADEAISILETRKDIRIVFTDINLPGSMDGPDSPQARLLLSLMCRTQGTAHALFPIPAGSHRALCDTGSRPSSSCHRRLVERFGPREVPRPSGQARVSRELRPGRTEVISSLDCSALYSWQSTRPPIRGRHSLLAACLDSFIENKLKESELPLSMCPRLETAVKQRLDIPRRLPHLAVVLFMP